ncbi:MAG: DMT family transporter [Myxococcales bacterium]|nr:DMT family transporter [Myxococcales bacterium]
MTQPAAPAESTRPTTRLRTAALTTVAMLAFAANSILCRAALGGAKIDAASFSGVRLLSGALVLVALLGFTGGSPLPRGGSWLAAAMLFLYAVPFSFAYVSLATGTGALILFGAVQATMLVAALRSGERPHPLQWLGLLLAIFGLIYMVLPGVSAPPLPGAALMAVAGIAWGLYTLRGKGVGDPLQETAANFTRSLPFVLVLAVLTYRDAQLTPGGLSLAIASGALASGLGYAIWYSAVPGLTRTAAASVQLTVPVIAALGGVVFMSERITLRLTIASSLILGGVLLALLASRRTR